MMSLRSVALCVVWASAAVRPAAAQPPTLDVVLQRAGAYVADFHRRLSGIVAEEQYVQNWRPGRSTSSSGLAHRVLLSDLLLIKPEGADAWMEFRDVFDVDGQPVRERDQRLVKMFLEPSPSTNTQIGRILRESARFNIGDIDRNMNTPVLPLLFLETANHARFRFKRTGDRTPKNAGGKSATAGDAFRVSTEVWVIGYEETLPRTMIRTTADRDLPSRGRFWIDPDTGRVLMSELTAEDTFLRATVDVSYQSEPLLGLLVPVEMRERYESKRRGSQVDGRATYGRFRQFQVMVDEKLAPVVKP